MQSSISTQPHKTEQQVFLVFLLWSILSFLAGYYQFFTYFPGPVFGITVAGILAALVTLYLVNNNFREFADKVPLHVIALFHVWRIFAGWLFLSFSGTLSATFIQNAAWGDIISGLLGIGVFIAGQRKWAYWTFNVIGMLDFVVAVGTGLTLTILGDPQMNPIVQLPLIMIPLLGVPISGFTHIVSIRKLMKLNNASLTDKIS